MTDEPIIKDDTPAEPKFGWRRLYVFVSLALTYGLLWLIVRKVEVAEELKWIAYGLMSVHTIAMCFWSGGASMSDWALLTKAWRKPDA